MYQHERRFLEVLGALDLFPFFKVESGPFLLGYTDYTDYTELKGEEKGPFL